MSLIYASRTQKVEMLFSLVLCLMYCKF